MSGGRWRDGWRELRRYPSALVGMAIIAALVGLSLYTLVAIPYPEALDKWRGGEPWRLHPVNAGPAWADRLSGERHGDHRADQSGDRRSSDLPRRDGLQRDAGRHGEGRRGRQVGEHLRERSLR